MAASAPNLTARMESGTSSERRPARTARLFLAVKECQRQCITDALARCGGNRQRAAQWLGVTRGYLVRLMRSLDVVAPPARYFWGRPAVVDLAEARRLARTYSATRAAEFLGVHRQTLRQIADREGIVFQQRRHYGWSTGRDHAK